MKLIKNRKAILISIFFVITTSLFLFSNNNFSFCSSLDHNNNNNLNSPKVSQIDNLVINQKFDLMENAQDSNTQENISSINLGLPGETWNLTSIELNVTNIKQEREIKTIEDNSTGGIIRYIQKASKYYMRSMQIQLDKNTTIYGAYIYGLEIIPGVKIKVGITDFDNVNHIPDLSKIYISQELNISNSLNWYYQNFTSNPIHLPKGNYSLILNGSDIADEGTVVGWYCNYLNPINPNLYTSFWQKTPPTWVGITKGESYLCKLVQKTNTSYNPTSIEMKAEFDGVKYDISDGDDQFSGNLLLSINYCPQSDTLHVPIYTNQSLLLNFSISYDIKVQNKLISTGSLEVDENLNNLWTINPTLTRHYNNYSIEFDYPMSWKNVSVFRKTNDNFVNVTSPPDVIRNGNTLLILNNTIIPEAEWKITAQSVKKDFTLDVPEVNFGPGQNLGFFVDDPVLLGNYTFVVYDSIGLEVHREVEVISVASRFSLNVTIPDNPNGGDWDALVSWNNATHAGLEIQIFQIGDSGGGTTVILPDNDNDDDNGDSGIDPMVVVVIIIIAGAVAAGSMFSYVTLKKVQTKRELHKELLHNKVLDILSLNYIIIIAIKNGLNVYEQFFAGRQVDATLISGFLDAIRSFGIELTGTYDQSQTIKLEYKESKILMEEYRNHRLILILKENASDAFIDSIRDLSHDIEENYGQLISDFKGDLHSFKGIADLIDKHLYTSFISPLRIMESKITKISPTEKMMISRAKQLMKQNSLDYFFTSFLMLENMDSKNTKAIFSLIEKGVFNPISLDIIE